MLGFSIPSFIRILSSAVWLAMSCAVYAQTYEESVAEYEKLDFASALVGLKSSQPKIIKNHNIIWG
jgi:hypothetical protein